MKARIIPIKNFQNPEGKTLSENDIALYARAMQQNNIDDLPEWLQEAVNQNYEYRSWAIDYYLWLEYPTEYPKPLPIIIAQDKKQDKRVGMKKTLFYWSAVACLVLIVGVYPLISQYYYRWQQEQQYAANFRENPTRDAVFLGVRMNINGKSSKINYKLKNLLSQDGEIPFIAITDSFSLAWQLIPIEQKSFEPQRVILQIWDNTKSMPIIKTSFTQTSSLWEKVYNLNLEPGIYYVRLQFDNQVETLAKLKLYRSNL